MKQLKIYLMAGALLSPLCLFAQTGNDQIPTVSSEALINLQQHSVANQEMNAAAETDVDSKDAQKRKAETEKAQKKAEKKRQKAQKKAEKEAQKEAEKKRKEAEKKQKEAEKKQKEAEKVQEEAEKVQQNADEKAKAVAAPVESVEPAEGVATPTLSLEELPTTKKVVAVDGQQGNPKKMQKQHEEKANEIEELLSKIAKHDDAPAYLLMMAEHIEENWIAKPFSEYSVARLEMAIRTYERVADQCDGNDKQKLLRAAQRLKVLYDDAQLYEEAYRAVNSCYDKELVAPLIPKMRKLRDGTDPKKHPDKSQDLKSLTYQLNFYDAKVDIFKDLIDAFDEALKDAQDRNGRLEQLKKEYEEDIDAICENPWLQGQFDEYMKNPLNSPVRATIKGLVTE